MSPGRLIYALPGPLTGTVLGALRRSSAAGQRPGAMQR